MKVDIHSLDQRGGLRERNVTSSTPEHTWLSSSCYQKKKKKNTGHILLQVSYKGLHTNLWVICSFTVF